MTSSTVSSESAPRSFTKDESFFTSASFTPNCSATIFLTRCSMFSIKVPFPLEDDELTARGHPRRYGIVVKANAILPPQAAPQKRLKINGNRLLHVHAAVHVQ